MKKAAKILGVNIPKDARVDFLEYSLNRTKGFSSGQGGSHIITEFYPDMGVQIKARNDGHGWRITNLFDAKSGAKHRYDIND